MTATALRHASADHGPGAAVSGKAVPGLSSIPPEVWNRIDSDGSGALSHGYLSAWETAELSGLCSRPVIAYTPDGRAAAACPGYLYDLDLVGVRLPAARPLMQPLRRLRPRLLLPRTYELGSPTPLTRPFLVKESAHRPAAVKALIQAAVEEGSRSGAQFLLVQNFTTRTGPAAEQLEQLGFAPVPIPPTAVVDLPYDSFEGYLAAMRAQYRRRARQTLKRSADLRVEHHEEFADMAEELAAQWRLIYERATELKREILTPAYFRAASELPESSVLLLTRSDGSIASFALLLADGPWLSFLQCGFDATAGRSEGAYFRLLYEIVRIGIDRGFRQVDLGITTLQPKLDVGGVPVPLFAWLKHRNPLIQRILRGFADRLAKPESLEPRRVFKEAPAAASQLVASRGLPS